MAKEKSLYDELVISLRNAGTFGLVVAGIAAAITFFSTPVIFWPVIGAAALHAGGCAFLSYAGFSASNYSMDNRFSGATEIVSGIGGIVLGLAGMIGTIFYLFPSLMDKSFNDDVKKTLTATADANFHDNWHQAKKDQVFKVNFPLGKTMVPATATVAESTRTFYTSRDGGDLRLYSCIAFNAATDPGVRKPFHKTVTVCQYRVLNDKEMTRILGEP